MVLAGRLASVLPDCFLEWASYFFEGSQGLRYTVCAQFTVGVPL